MPLYFKNALGGQQQIGARLSLSKVRKVFNPWKRPHQKGSYIGAYLGEVGVSFISLALILPIILLIMTFLLESGRLLLTYTTANQVIGAVVKLASAYSPVAYAPVSHRQVAGEHNQMIYPLESEQTPQRVEAWRNQLTADAPGYHGKSYYTEKELAVFNLGYGYLRELNSRIYFPIPSNAEGVDQVDQLEGRVNCTLSFEFDSDNTFTSPQLENPPGNPPGNALAADPPITSAAVAAGPAFYNAYRNRIYTLECRVPFISGGLARALSGRDFMTVVARGYAYRSGGILPSPDIITEGP